MAKHKATRNWWLAFKNDNGEIKIDTTILKDFLLSLPPSRKRKYKQTRKHEVKGKGDWFYSWRKEQKKSRGPNFFKTKIRETHEWRRRIRRTERALIHVAPQQQAAPRGEQRLGSAGGGGHRQGQREPMRAEMGHRKPCQQGSYPRLNPCQY